MTKLVKWVSNDGQITEKGQSHGRNANFLPSVAESAYDLLRIEGYLGNVSLNCLAAFFEIRLPVSVGNERLASRLCCQRESYFPA